MTTAFVGGNVFVGDGEILEHATVLVEGDRITGVGGGHVPVPKEARVIPLDGRMLLPGFIDCHVHLCLDGSADSTSVLVHDPVPLTTLKAARMARETLMAGITSVRDLGGTQGIDLSVRNAVKAGIIQGPRMLASGLPICMTGGHGWQFGFECDGADEVRRAARSQIKAGADVVKLMATGGVLTPGVEPGSEQFTEEELRAGVQEAHKASRRTATHAQGTQGIVNALKAGIDSIEHGFYLNEEAVSLMKARNVPLVPTISALHNIVTMGVEAGIPAFAVEKTLKARDAHFQSIRMAHEAGVPVLMGTDAGTPFNLHGRNLDELKRLTECGFTSVEALIAGTKAAAELLGMGHDVGSIEVGKRADLVIVEGNPVDDIDILVGSKGVSLVMQGGVFVKGA